MRPRPAGSTGIGTYCAPKGFSGANRISTARRPSSPYGTATLVSCGSSHGAWCESPNETTESHRAPRCRTPAPPGKRPSRSVGQADQRGRAAVPPVSAPSTAAAAAPGCDTCRRRGGPGAPLVQQVGDAAQSQSRGCARSRSARPPECRPDGRAGSAPPPRAARRAFVGEHAWRALGRAVQLTSTSCCARSSGDSRIGRSRWRRRRTAGTTIEHAVDQSRLDQLVAAGVADKDHLVVQRRGPGAPRISSPAKISPPNPSESSPMVCDVFVRRLRPAGWAGTRGRAPLADPGRGAGRDAHVRPSGQHERRGGPGDARHRATSINRTLVAVDDGCCRRSWHSVQTGTSHCHCLGGERPPGGATVRAAPPAPGRLS